jgi:hypothetical protein
MGFTFNKPVVAGTVLVRSAIQSQNYGVDSSGTVTGWQIASDGSATFTEITVGGADYNIDTEGNASFETVTANTDIILAGTSLLETLDDLPDGLVAFGDSATANTSGVAWTVDSVGIGSSARTPFGFSFGPVDPTHIYRITIGYGWSSDTTANVYQHTLRTTTDGTNPTSSSGIVDDSNFNMPPATLNIEYRANEVYWYYPSSAIDIVKMNLFFLRVVGGSGGLKFIGSNPNNKAVVAVEDLGVRTDAVAGGSLSQFNKASGTDDATPPKTYVKTYNCNWSRSWDSGGSTVHSTNGELVQGSFGGFTNRLSWMGFPFSTIQSDLTSATVLKVEAYLYFDHWYYNAGGIASIGYHNSTATSAPAYNSALDTLDQKQVDWNVGQGKWVDISAFSLVGWKNGNITGITISGNGSSNLDYYGKGRGNTQSHEPMIRITYRK